MNQLGPIYLKKSEKRSIRSGNNQQVQFDTPDRGMRIEVSDRYKYFLRSLRNGTRIPCALMKIGIIAGEIQAKTHSIQVVKKEEKIKNTPVVDSSPIILSEFRRYMSSLQKNNSLSDSSKKLIGNIINISKLGNYPKNAGDFCIVVPSDRDYQGIRVKSYTDKYDLDEIEPISQNISKETRSGSPPPEEEIREHRKAVQDDVELDKV
ncbi:hypothetical protein EXE43_08235 [Halorubrum sp. SS5]|nr:hypothetical protein EXE43_08235 [Halorubrum sp. SS5]